MVRIAFDSEIIKKLEFTSSSLRIKAKSGAVVVGIFAYILWKKTPKYVELAALFEPIGTVFIGGTIAQLIAPIGGIEGLFTLWGLFAASCIPGSIIGFVILLALKKEQENLKYPYFGMVRGNNGKLSIFQATHIPILFPLVGLQIHGILKMIKKMLMILE